MRSDHLLLSCVLLASCGGEPGPTQQEHDALLQRLDAMEQRLDALEDAADESAGAAVAIAAKPAVPGPIALPSPAAAPPIDAASPERSIQVRVRTDGLQIDGKEVAESEAREQFGELLRARPAASLMLLAEPDVTHARVTRVLDLARDAGIEKISLAARFHEPGDPPDEPPAAPLIPAR